MKKENCICPAKAYITDERSNLYEGTRAMKDEESHLIPVYIFDMYPYPDCGAGLGHTAEVLGFAQRHGKQRGAHHDRLL